MSQLALYLLGPPRLERDGVPVEFRYRKNIALIAYLAVTGQPHTRETLITLLWPELEPSRARAILRRDLSLLRKALGGEWLVVDRETVSLDSDTAPWIDVDQFCQRLAACKTHGHPVTEACPDCTPLLEEAVELYRADFMAGFTLRDSAAFDEFQFFQTEGLKDQLAGALVRLVTYHASQGDFESAISHARRWLALDPLHELAHRHLMQLYAQTGQRSAALRQYEECVRILGEELGLSPSRETTSLYEQIRIGPADSAEGAEPGFVAPRPRHNLPAQPTPFIGREPVLAEIRERLEDPACRLLTLVGPGGSGKTRLALEAAAGQVPPPLQRLPGISKIEPSPVGADTVDLESAAEPSQGSHFEDGVFFVPLAPLRTVDSIVPTVAGAVGFSFHGAEIEPRQQLLDYLRQKRMLVVLDNFEHLLSPPSIPPASGRDEEKIAGGGAELVIDILEAAPEVKVLTTSRAGLRVQGEHLYPVGGMDVPPLPSPEDGRGAGGEGEYSAVKLFLDSARRARPGFELTADNVVDVVCICHLVEGMPLGVVLAAAWAGMLKPAEIAAEIARSLDFLETKLHGVPARQRSMRAAFDHSWKLLTQREREVFQGLSVFRGGFTRLAAQQVTTASLRELRMLVDRSLVSRTPTGRYEVHELLRQYAEERLDQSPGAAEAMRDLHGAHYTAALQQWGEDLKGPRQMAALAQMDVEIENVRAAWDWAAERERVALLDQGVEGLSRFYIWRGRWDEGETAYRAAAEKLTAIEEALEPDGLRVLARILAKQARFHLWLGRTELARQLLQRSLALLERPVLAAQDVRSERAHILLYIGELGYGSEFGSEELTRLWEQSLALFRALGDRWWTAYALAKLGVWTDNLGEAKRLVRQSLKAYQALGDRYEGAYNTQHVGFVALYQGEFEEAEHLIREALAVHREIGNRDGVALALTRLGLTVMWRGRFAEAHSLLKESIAISEDCGNRRYRAEGSTYLGLAEAHLARYAQAHAQAPLDLARECGWWYHIGYSLIALGSVALAEEAYAEAQRLLQEGVAICREIEWRNQLGWTLAVLGYAARGLGQPSQARQHLCEALRTATEIGMFLPLLYALPVAALLLADQGEVERAVELYGLASRYPFVANSRWFEDVAGKHIAAVASTLPPDVVAAAQERGRARDLDATVAELLEELAA